MGETRSVFDRLIAEIDTTMESRNPSGIADIQAARQAYVKKEPPNHETLRNEQKSLIHRLNKAVGMIRQTDGVNNGSPETEEQVQEKPFWLGLKDILQELIKSIDPDAQFAQDGSLLKQPNQ